MNLRASKKVLINSLLVDIEYRFNHLMLIFSSVLTLVMEWAVFSHVFEGRSEVGGLPRESAFSFILVGMVLRTFQTLWGRVAEAIDEIREGTFRRFLLQPIFHPFFFFSQAVGWKVTTLGMCILICAVFKFMPMAPGAYLSAESLPLALGAFVMSTVLFWLIYLNIVYVSFFVEESHFLLWTLNISIGVFSGTLIPLSWLPEWLQKMLHLTPFPTLGDWTLRSSLGLCTGEEWMNYLQVSTGWIVFFCALGLLLYKKGLKRYEAFGG